MPSNTTSQLNLNPPLQCMTGEKDKGERKVSLKTVKAIPAQVSLTENVCNEVKCFLGGLQCG